MHCFVLHRLLLGQCRAGASLSDPVRLEHTLLLGVMGVILRGSPSIFKALLLSSADLEEGKRYSWINPPFLLPLPSSETGGFEVRGDWSKLGRCYGVAGREITEGLG